MIKKVDRNCKIFESDELYNDKYLFHGMMGIIDNSYDMYSDEKNCLIVYDNASSNIWIWTKDNIDKMSFLFKSSLLSEINKIIKLYSDDFSKNIICKPSLYVLLKKKLMNEKEEQLTCMDCEVLKQPQECDGSIYFPSDNKLDIDNLGEIYFDCNCELYGKNNVTLEDSKIKIQEMIRNGSLYAWKNNKGEVVSMIECQEDNSFGNLTSLYTIKDEREKGYGSNLVYYLTSVIKESERRPVIYVENVNNISMNTYEKVGYKDRGQLCYIANSPIKNNYKGGKLK